MEEVRSVSQALKRLEEIDRLIWPDVHERSETSEDSFTQLVQQKEQLRAYITRETGKIAHWTERGYELVSPEYYKEEGDCEA